jgi:hypothetical protein
MQTSFWSYRRSLQRREASAIPAAPATRSRPGAYVTTIASQFSFGRARGALGSLFGPDLHAKRIDCLSDATLGVLHSASLAVAAIAHGLAAARGLTTKHAIKQVNLLLSNPGIKIDDILGPVGTLRRRRPHLSRGGDGLDRLRVRIIGDRGFGDHKLYRLLSEQLHFDYVIRFRGNSSVTAADSETRTAAAWARPDGRARTRAAPRSTSNAMRSAAWCACATRT